MDDQPRDPGLPPPVGAAAAVTDRSFHAGLEDLVRDCDPRAGLFGPGSMMWTVGRESALMFGGARSVLLQLAHPFVSGSLKYVSGPGRDVRERFIRTMRYCSAMTFGDRAEVAATAREVHAIHRRVGGRLDEDAGRFARGTRFRAGDVEALWWVAATLWDSSVLAFETFVRPLEASEKDAYLRDGRRWSRLFGIPDSAMPRDWPAFERYMRDMLASDVLAVSDRARAAARHILQSPRRRAAPLYAWIRMLTAAQLPPRLREEFGLPFGPRERRLAGASVRVARTVIRHLPQSLRYNPMYIRAQRRLAGDPRPDPVSEGVLRLLLAALQGHGPPGHPSGTGREPVAP